MKRGAAMVDISIDQGGCFETSKPTTHADPTYIVDDVVHYCVTNMPGAVPRTSAQALNNATLPFVIALANRGYESAIAEDPHLADRASTYTGARFCMRRSRGKCRPPDARRMFRSMNSELRRAQ